MVHVNKLKVYNSPLAYFNPSQRGKGFFVDGDSVGGHRVEAVFTTVPRLSGEVRGVSETKIPGVSARQATARAGELSARQVECLQRIACGETSAQIAASLGLSPRTVDHYVGDACAKLGVRSRAQAVALAISLNIVMLPTPQ